MSFGYKLEHCTTPLLTLMLPEPSKVKLTAKVYSCKGTKRYISYISTDSFHLLQTSDEQYGFPVTYKYAVLRWLLKFCKSKKFYFALYLCYLKFYFYYISYLRCMFYFIINCILCFHYWVMFFFCFLFLDCTELLIFYGYHLLL